ncbi:hypothetical protein ACVGVM_13775 [Pseudonocardia bannensis]|uniref:Secreted protein n=1 Tax=Pseudonocardia bannensis TaxID=630973 RepID=A0A848DMS7_9PSEU|nr:hypothetical protein [Pseudonocardia bannensis]NMH94077.1 hypothetical protein [Pseudonocardia bannensis]
MNSSAVIVVIIVAVVVLAAIGAAVYLLGGRRRSERLKERFGPEYERSLAETDDRRKTEEQLAEREKRHRKLSLRSLDDRERAGFQDRWIAVQRGFVDDPDRAVERADALIVEIMSARGYPVTDFDQRAADISVEHPVVVQHYREAQRISAANARGGVDTEELRRAVTSYRSLVEALLDEHGARDRSREDSHNGRTSPRNEETQV